jgi:hypothetical protein
MKAAWMAYVLRAITEAASVAIASGPTNENTKKRPTQEKREAIFGSNRRSLQRLFRQAVKFQQHLATAAPRPPGP